MVADHSGVTLDATRIAPHLYQGSFPHPLTDLKRAGFDVLVLCAREVQPPPGSYPGVSVGRCPLIDRDCTDEEWQMAQRTAREVAERVKRGQRVLVTCAAGRNRSGLVVALALHHLTPMSSSDIIKHIKTLRENALTNREFCKMLERLRPAREAA